MRAYVINIMVVLIIFPVIHQTVINLIMLSKTEESKENKGKKGKIEERVDGGKSGYLILQNMVVPRPNWHTS